MASRGSVVAVVVEGLQRMCVPTKHYLFLLKVRRSDGSEYTLRKSYEEFVALEIEIMKMQIDASTQNKLRLKKTGVAGANGGYRTASKRQSNISAYCDALLCADDVITTSDVVQKFFEPERRQTNENGFRMDASSKTGIEQESWAKGKPTGPVDISAPIDLPVYRTTVAYEADDERQISLQANLHVQVFQKCYSGWWFVIYKQKSGWFPATHLESVEPGGRDDEPGPLEQPQKYVTVTAYTAQYSDELSFPADAVVDVLHKKMDGWWLLRLGGKSGIGPSKFLKACDVNAERCECKMCDDTLDMKSTMRRKSTVVGLNKGVSQSGTRNSLTDSHSSKANSESNYDSFSSGKTLDKSVTVVGGSKFYSCLTETESETRLTEASVQQSDGSSGWQNYELESSAHGDQTKL